MRTEEHLRTEADAPVLPGDGPPSQRRKVFIFGGLCVACLSLALSYGIYASGRENRAAQQVATAPATADLADLAAQPRLLFQSRASARADGALAVAPLDDPDGPQARAGLDCDRVDFSQGLGVCLTPRRNIISPSEAVVFDHDFEVVHRLGVPGLPSRVRLSPDGRLAGVTSFVDGHSYAAEFFSTKTVIVDVDRGEVLHDLERFTVFRDGQAISEIDFNFWGVTFTDDSNRFFATLGTGDHRYLVEGDLGTQSLTVLRDDVECPSLSPDGARIAFKQREPNPFGPVTWQLSVLDLRTNEITAVAETRNVDDQAEWLDDDQILYGLRRLGTNVTDTFVVPADGSGQAQLFLPGASSAVVVGTGS